MGLRDDFLKKIQKQQNIVSELASSLRAESRALEALQDAFRLIPRDAVADTNGSTPGMLRKGSGTHKAYEALKRLGRPSHVKDIAEAIGKKPTRQNTQGLASSMRAYVLRGEIFTKPAPNTYGLVEWSNEPEPAPPGTRKIDLEEES